MHFLDFFRYFWSNWVGKTIFSHFNISALLVNTSTAEDELTRPKWGILPNTLQTPISRELLNFCHLFIAFLASTWNLESFKKKFRPIASINSELRLPKDMGVSVKKTLNFWKPFRTERVKKSLKILKSAKIAFFRLFSLFLVKLSGKNDF